MSEALPMPGEDMPARKLSLDGGYTWSHGGYTKKQGLDMIGQRQFIPPNNLRWAGSAVAHTSELTVT